MNALGPLWIEADLSLGVPLVRDTFALAPTTDVYRAPGVVPTGGLGLRVALP